MTLRSSCIHNSLTTLWQCCQRVVNAWRTTSMGLKNVTELCEWICTSRGLAVNRDSSRDVYKMHNSWLSLLLVTARMLNVSYNRQTHRPRRRGEGALWVLSIVEDARCRHAWHAPFTSLSAGQVPVYYETLWRVTYAAVEQDLLDSAGKRCWLILYRPTLYTSVVCRRLFRQSWVFPVCFIVS